MRLEDVDEFFPSSEDVKFSCMEYVPESTHGYDILFVGSLCGRVFAFPFAKRKAPRSLRPEDISRDLLHSGQVTCLAHSHNPKLSSGSSEGVLYSGSNDRTIKVWSANSASPKLLQTLYGHEGSITQVADAQDGTILSCSVDGALRLWKPQRGRNFLSQAFLECTCVVRMKNTWLSAMAINPLNSWSCYVADMDGNVQILKKGSELNQAEHRTAIFTGQLTKHKRWEKVHRLGITCIELVPSENILVTASSDFTAKVLDMHIGTTLFTIANSRNCKYTGFVWNVPKFQVYMCDENGYMDVWSSFYERIVETFVMCKWSGNIRAGRGDGIGPKSKANLLAQPLVSSITQHKDDGFILSLHPRTGTAHFWQIENEGTVVSFEGHDGNMILALGVIENSRANYGYSLAEEKVNDLISLEESTFFSVGEDNMLCCWDEYDRTERYSIRLKHSTEVVCVLTVWFIHSIVTAHDNGTICVWNIDSGTKVKSNDMRGSAITAFAVGKNKHKDDILIAVDRDGKIGSWNLTLFQAHLSSLPFDYMFTGFHDPSDPSIMSVDAHIPSGTVFTGGNDGCIKYWRLKLDHEAQSLNFHEGHTVWSLYARQDYLLSGDESGRIVLWSIEMPPSESLMGSHQRPVVVTKLAMWSSGMLGSFQCCHLDEVNNSAFICLTDVSCKFSSLWRVSKREALLDDSSGSGDCPAKEKRTRKVSIEAKVTTTTTTLDASSDPDRVEDCLPTEESAAETSRGAIHNLSVPYDTIPEGHDASKPETNMAKSGDKAASVKRNRRVSTFSVFPSALSSKLSFHSIATIKHDGIEPSCMRCRVGDKLHAGSDGETAPKGTETCIYIGSMNGVIQKHIIGQSF